MTGYLPCKNESLARLIVEKGLLISEFPLQTPPLASNFPRRNRLISGLSSGCLVAEAALRSGSLITARLANEAGKEVFAIPGSIHSPVYQGYHHLIREGAQLVETPAHIVDTLSAIHMPASPKAASETTVTSFKNSPDADSTKPSSSSLETLSPLSSTLLQVMSFEACSLDYLSEKTMQPIELIQAELLNLELSGQVSLLNNGLYQARHEFSR